MASINKPARTPAARETLRTHEGAPARRISVEAQLRRTVLACMLWEDTFYEDGVKVADRITTLCKQLPQETLADIAIEAREEMYLRHVPLLIVRNMARKGGPLVGKTLARVIQRPDELTEFLAIYWGSEPTQKVGSQTKGQSLPAQVKLGLAEAFTKFDAYQLAKYDRDGAVRLKDVLFLVHPKPKDDAQDVMWKKLVDGTLKAPDTWEVALSAGEDKKESWTRLVLDNKLGGMAVLRNLRNMEWVGVGEDVIRYGINQGKFRRVLPFRFLSAARHAPKYEPELEAAMFRSTADMPRLKGKTALVLDHSDSMNARISTKSEVTRMDTAGALAVLLREICEKVVVIAFSSIDYGRKNSKDVAIVPPRRGFALIDAFKDSMVSWGTNTESGIQCAKEQGYDRVIVITDEQSHQQVSGPGDDKLGYFVNVASYRNGIGYGKWIHIDGWSESIVRYIQAIENVD